MNDCCYCCSFLFAAESKLCQVEPRCECLLVICQVYAAESKLRQVEHSINRILAEGKVECQMKSFLEETNTKVKEAFSVCVQSMWVYQSVVRVCMHLQCVHVSV